MLGHSHATSGALAWAALAPTLLPALPADHLDAKDVIAGTFVCAGAALLPDIDHKHGTIAHSLGPLSRLVTWIMHGLSGGHRHATHSLLFAAGAGAVTFLGQDYIGRWFVLGVVFVLLALAVQALHLCPGGHQFRSWGVIVAEALVGTWVIDTWLLETTAWLPYAVMLGCLVHLVGDSLTDRGVPWLWPIGHRFGIPVIDHTGNFLETKVLSPAMTVATLAALWFLTVSPAHLVAGG